MIMNNQKKIKVFYVPCSESKTMSKKTKEEKEVDVALLKKQQQILDAEQHKNLTKSLSVADAKKLDETDKIISKVETNLIDNENSNLHIIKNLSVDLKEILPLNKMYEGTDIKQLDKFKFNNSVMLKFTNKVLLFLFGKNADTVQRDNPLYFKALRDTTPSIILELVHGVIINKDCFSSPTGRKPKMINFNFSKIYRYVKKPKSVKDDKSAKDYFNSKFNKGGKPTDYISFELFNNISKFILMNVEQADGDVPLLRKLNAINEYIDAGNNYFASEQLDKQVDATKDCITNLLDVANNSKKFEILFDALINLTDNSETFEDFKKHIKSFESKSVKIKTYQAVKFDGSKVKYLQADDTPSLIKQLQNV